MKFYTNTRIRTATPTTSSNRIITAIYSIHGEYDKVRESFERALEIDPANECAKQPLESLQPES